MIMHNVTIASTNFLGEQGLEMNGSTPIFSAVWEKPCSYEHDYPGRRFDRKNLLPRGL
ncbi:MAG: hypothetical protein ACREBS_09025 [Nitrososphaerales archaeon]